MFLPRSLSLGLPAINSQASCGSLARGCRIRSSRPVAHERVRFPICSARATTLRGYWCLTSERFCSDTPRPTTRAQAFQAATCMRAGGGGRLLCCHRDCQVLHCHIRKVVSSNPCFVCGWSVCVCVHGASTTRFTCFDVYAAWCRSSAYQPPASAIQCTSCTFNPKHTCAGVVTAQGSGGKKKGHVRCKVACCKVHLLTYYVTQHRARTCSFPSSGHRTLLP
jgi:hypothetical protein